MKRVLTFGAAVFVVSGLGFLPMIGCVASSGQDADEADEPLALEARRPRAERNCGRDGLRCCAHACCLDGSACIYIRRTRARICMQNPPPNSRILPSACGE